METAIWGGKMVGSMTLVGFLQKNPTYQKAEKRPGSPAALWGGGAGGKVGLPLSLLLRGLLLPAPFLSTAPPALPPPPLPRAPRFKASHLLEFSRPLIIAHRLFLGFK